MKTQDFCAYLGMERLPNKWEIAVLSCCAGILLSPLIDKIYVFTVNLFKDINNYFANCTLLVRLSSLACSRCADHHRSHRNLLERAHSVTQPSLDSPRNPEHMHRPQRVHRPHSPPPGYKSREKEGI